jgi:hypothetical protein
LVSNTGGVPLEAVQVCEGPGIALSYQAAKSATGEAMTGAVLLTPTLPPGMSFE